jgi:multidrug resistance efflux pump
LKFLPLRAAAPRSAAPSLLRRIAIPSPLDFLLLFFVIMSSVSDWDNQYAQLARAASQFRTSGITSSSSDLQAFTSQGQRLKSQLPSLQTYLTPAEYKRRETLIQSLMITATSKSSAAVAMEQQDAMIDELGVGVGRLKNQTQLISDEAKLHTTLLSDMENNVEAAQYSLNQETRRAELVRENQSVWRLQLCIAGLVILFILLILMGLS